ncbi:hypothetical protein L596_013918 [Steinernema carpocapsae]|uniref:Gustatory receptor n=1 Tax=Steinernema carpocapsae TaxID=34508 RepID=A0A4U5P1M2_STECR|nr:hypothetical protein L596_013918 [Steinernema carpocapsae]
MKVLDVANAGDRICRYQKSVIDKHEEPQLCNLLGVRKLLIIAHVFGVHPFKGTTKHRTDQCCDKGTFLSKISILGAFFTFVNLLVVINHTQFDVIQYYLPMFAEGIFSEDATESFLQIVIFVVAFLTLITISLNVTDIHKVLHLVNTLQICTPYHQRIISGGKIFSILIFMIAYLCKVVAQIYTYVFSTKTSVTNTKSLTTFLDQYGPIEKVLVVIDAVYYNLIEFPVCQIPLLYLALIALGIGFAFKENADRFEEVTPMTEQSLKRYHEGLNKLSEILCMCDKSFNKLLLLTVFSALVQIIFRTYLFCRTVINPNSDFIFVLLNTSNLLISNVVWTFGFVLGTCVYVNETSRIGIFKITSELVDDKLKSLKDQVYYKLMDYSWGFTIGKFARIERPLILTMVSLIFTIVVVWLQFSMTNNTSSST